MDFRLIIITKLIFIRNLIFIKNDYYFNFKFRNDFIINLYKKFNFLVKINYYYIRDYC